MKSQFFKFRRNSTSGKKNCIEGKKKLVFLLKAFSLLVTSIRAAKLDA